MSFHLAVYRSSIPVGTVFTYVSPIADPVLRIEGLNIIVPDELSNLGAIAGFSPNIREMRFETPSIRREVLLEVRPVAVAVNVASPFIINRKWTSPIPLDPSEPARLLAFHGHTAAEMICGLVWFVAGAVTPVEVEYFTVKGTTGSVPGTGVWENTSLTFDQTLPAGVYTVIGARVEHASGLAFRLVFVGGGWRPGGPCDRSPGDVLGMFFRGGQLGEWGTFRHDQPPTVDILATAAGVATVYLDVVRGV